MTLHKTRDFPKLIYGTAWKEEATENLVCQAITIGFRGIDTANQRRHYHEAAVGNAISTFLKNGMKREELFIQTKFTSVNGQDHRLPYDPQTDYKTQVRQSFQSSLDHLQIDYIDSYLLHGPSSRFGLTIADWQVWQEMEALHQEGLTRYLGISNVSIEQLKVLYAGATVKPTFVQNRCFAEQGWDKEVREFCQEKEIIYQGFSLLTANQIVLPNIKHIAQRVAKTPAQVIFEFAKQIGILPLTGTTDVTHMREDIDLDFTLTKEEIDFIENLAVH